MPRYVVERRFMEPLTIPTDHQGAATCLAVIQNNAEEQVTWVTSFVATDHKRTFCIYDGPSPAAIDRAAQANGLPVEAIHEVSILDPYFYVGGQP